MILLSLCLSAGLAENVNAQIIGDFRSLNGGGQWSKSGTWEEYTATGWVDTKNVPTSSDGRVTIRTGHIINANQAGSYDQFLIEAGAELNVTKAFTVLNGPGVDLDVYGTLSDSKTITFSAAATGIFRSGSSLSISRNNTFETINSSSVTFETGSSISNIGNIDLLNTSSITVNSGVTLTNASTISLTGQTQLLVNGGTIVNQDVITATGTSVISFSNNAVYVHDQNGGALPPITNTTWETNSEARITGVTNSVPTQLNTTFYDFTWQNSSQVADLSLAGAPVGILGDFTVAATGSRSLTWNSVGSPMNIGGDFIQTGGDFRFQDTGSAVIAIAGDFNQTAGTTYLSTTSGSPTLNVAGDFTVASALINSSTASATINLNGATAQLIDANGTLSGNIDLNLSGAGSKTLVSDLTLQGSLTETSGGIDLAGNSLSLSGNLIVTTSFTNASLVTFTGTGTQTIQLPTGSTIPELSIDGVGASLQLLSDINISNVFTLVNGSIDLNGFNVILAEGVVFYNTGTVSGPITMSRAYTWNDDGWRMIASPVSGINFSSLSSAFWTQGAAWATNPSGTSNLHSFNFSTQDWSAVTGADAAMGAATAYILYANKTHGWLSLLRESAMTESKEGTKGASNPPFYINVNPGSPRPPTDNPIHLFMIILSIAFYLIAIELIIRNLISQNQPVIKAIGRPAWIWAYRQISAYACLLAGVSYFLGPLGGLSIALGLAGVSLSIEFKEQYKNIGAILYLLIKSHVHVGSWIAYRDSVAQVTDLNLQSITLTLLDGKIVVLSPFALLHVSVSKWKPDQIRRETFEIGISRLSNLRAVRETVAQTLGDFAPVGTRHHAHIRFEDLNAEVTVVQIQTVIDGNKTTSAAILSVLERELTGIGVELRERREKVIAKVVTDSSSAKNGVFPPLKLVKIDKENAA